MEKDNDKLKVNVNMPVRVVDMADEYAQRTGVTRTAIINMAVAKYLQEVGYDFMDTKNQTANA